MTGNYSAQYAKFHAQGPGHRHGLKLLHKRLLAGLLPGDRNAPILDVGCGRGYALQDVQELGYTNLSGIETDAGQAEAARAAGLSVSHVASSEAFLDSHRGLYATVLLMDVLEHVPHGAQPAFLQSIAASLQPGGRLICTVPNAAAGIAAFWLYNDYTHHRSFTADSLSFLIEQNGFAQVRMAPVEFFLRPRFLFWLPTTRTLSWWMRCASRLRRRAEFIGELGWQRGRSIILTPNLLAVADKAAT